MKFYEVFEKVAVAVKAKLPNHDAPPMLAVGIVMLENIKPDEMKKYLAKLETQLVAAFTGK
jgi:hypothetical protein